MIMLEERCEVTIVIACFQVARAYHQCLGNSSPACHNAHTRSSISLDIRHNRPEHDTAPSHSTYSHFSRPRQPSCQAPPQPSPPCSSKQNSTSTSADTAKPYKSSRQKNSWLIPRVLNVAELRKTAMMRILKRRKLSLGHKKTGTTRMCRR
jgi:hypothetical protein